MEGKPPGSLTINFCPKSPNVAKCWKMHDQNLGILAPKHETPKLLIFVGFRAICALGLRYKKVSQAAKYQASVCHMFCLSSKSHVENVNVT